MISKQGPELKSGAELRSVTSPDGNHHLSIPTGSSIQFFSLEQNDIINRLEVKNKNFVNTLGGPQTEVESFDLTPDKKTLITVD